MNLWARPKLFSHVSFPSIQRRTLKSKRTLVKQACCSFSPRLVSVIWPLLDKPQSSKGHVAFRHIHKLYKFKDFLSFRASCCYTCILSRLTLKTPITFHIFRTRFVCVYSLWISEQTRMKTIISCTLPIDLSNGSTVCSLWGSNWIFICLMYIWFRFQTVSKPLNG